MSALRNDVAEAHAEAALTDADEAVDRAYGASGSVEAHIEALSARAQVRATLAQAVLLDDLYVVLREIAERLGR